ARWVRQTDFNNAEAVGYLADRLNRLGVEEKLLELGAVTGDAVAIGGGDDPVVFDFAPQVEIGAEILARRGEDSRLEHERPSATRRRQEDADYQERRGGMHRDAWRVVNAAMGAWEDDEDDDVAPVQAVRADFDEVFDDEALTAPAHEREPGLE
ncbi:MAG TPA: Obg family GTPase CgtA, partial [Candidatus Luteococcus avicola]|nr:Obg family GTPase CgtA [Candidatus Luteococcus avicola]